MQDEGIPSPNVALVKASDVPTLLGRIRPAWQAKDLIERVRRLINVDPSSACQRLFNATMHDLREKIIIAGVDIAREAAKQYKLPPVPAMLLGKKRWSNSTWRKSSGATAPDSSSQSHVHRFPFALLCVLHNIWQFFSFAPPPLLHAVTWSASISLSSQTLLLFASCPMAQCGQFDFPSALAFLVCVA